MIQQILETKEVAKYLQARDLVDRYKKVKNHILVGHVSGAQLRKRKPFTDEIWYFRINKKYRAFAYLDNITLKVFHIDNHQ